MTLSKFTARTILSYFRALKAQCEADIANDFMVSAAEKDLAKANDVIREIELLTSTSKDDR